MNNWDRIVEEISKWMAKPTRITKAAVIASTILMFGFKGQAITVESFEYGSFGKVTIYLPNRQPEAVVLFVSGDGGWNKGVVNMATYIVEQGAAVIGIDILQYYKNARHLKVKCLYPAGDFEDISMTVQKKYKIRQYLKPILLGYSSGATLVYGVLAQAPANTFKGAISLGFCPDIEISKPLCRGVGLSSHVLKENKAFYLEPCSHLTEPFIVLQGTNDQVCSFMEVKSFLNGMPMCELVELSKVGHGFSVAKNWLPQLFAAYSKIEREPSYAEKKSSESSRIPSASTSSELPLTLIPSTAKENLPLAVFISGDGGWTNFDQTISEMLAKRGMPVIGLDAQSYFWNEKDPQKTAIEISKAVARYMQQWNRKSFILVGYSFGACVAPFIANRFPDALKSELKGVFCISPDETGDFEIHLSDMLSINKRDKYNVLAEVKMIKSLNPVCLFGNEESAELRSHFIATGVKVETLPGNHHYNDDYQTLSLAIIRGLTGGN